MKFSSRAVAFIDILGFKDLIYRVEKHEQIATDQFKKLHEILKSHVLKDNKRLQNVPSQVKPKYLFVSDSLIISAPQKYKEYDGIAIVTLKAIEVAHKLLGIGLLLRGGIDVGNVWHDRSNIFGSGYVGAYQTEQLAQHPCILLSPEASDHANALSTNFIYGASNLWLSEVGKTIVNTLHPSYISSLEVYGREEQAFDIYRAKIIHNLENLTPGCAARSKWEWAAQFFNKAIDRHNVQADAITFFPFPH